MLGRPCLRQQVPHGVHPAGERGINHIGHGHPALVLPRRRPVPALWRLRREDRAGFRCAEDRIGPAESLLSERGDRQPPRACPGAQALGDLVKPRAAALDPGQVVLRRLFVYQDRPRSHGQEHGGPGVLHGGDGVLVGGHVNARHLLRSRLGRATERDGVGRAELPLPDLSGLVEEAAGLGAPCLLSFRAVVGEQVVVPGDAVHGGGERIGVQPPLVEPVGQVTRSGHLRAFLRSSERGACPPR